MREPGLAAIAELGSRALSSSAEAIAAVGELVHRVTGVDITVVSEVTADGRYVFRSIESLPVLPVGRDDSIPWEESLCARGHAGESPATVPDTRHVPALWASWQRLRGQLGVDWDVLAFCTRDIRLPDGTFFGTLCIHHREPRVFSADEQGLLDVLARLLAQEVWRERAAARLHGALSELELAQRQRVELAEELRHELRAPLQVIDGYAEAMFDDVVSRDDEHVVLVRREAGRAMRLLDDLVDLVRLEAQADDAEPASVDAAAVVDEMRERLAPLAEAAGVELAAVTETANVLVARKRLEQLVVNVVRNALRATQHGAGSRIALSVRREGELVAIGIEDDGPGMQGGELDRAFERFFRGASARDAAEGSGLGLTVARRIVEAAGGELAIEPVDPHGLRLIARVPAAESGTGGDHSAIEA